MEINERISKARGECIHKSGKRDGGCCVDCGVIAPYTVNAAPLYDSDPTAWAPELYQWIDEENLAVSFILNLRDVVSDIGSLVYICPDTETFNEAEAFFLLSATPAQKAQALARAIEERSYDGK